MSTNRVQVAPAMLRWARLRSGRQPGELAKAFPKLGEWEAGESQPTFKQLERYARSTRTAVGYFFLATPPTEEVPLPDFRTIAGEEVLAPTPDLLDTIYACEHRQDWYREFAQDHQHDPVALVGSLSLDVEPVEAARRLRESLGFQLARRSQFSTWSAALDGLRDHAESAGVLVMINGVVGNDTTRVLDPAEFRGFALADRYAPVVFINGADTKAAQIFTLAHELGHLALGGSALSRPDLGDLRSNGDETESWCDRVGAELLVPLSALRVEYVAGPDLTAELDRLAKVYKVSTLVVLRRLADAGIMDRPTFRSAFQAERTRVLSLVGAGGSGGNFYNTEPIRVSKTFARALITDTAEGRTAYRDAFRLLGLKKLSTYQGLSSHLGLA